MTTKEEYDLEQIRATIANLNAETENLSRDTRLMPLKIFTAALATFIALGYVVLKFSSMLVASI